MVLTTFGLRILPEFDGSAFRRGSVQHEVFEGDAATTFVDDGNANIKEDATPTFRRIGGVRKKERTPDRNRSSGKLLDDVRGICQLTVCDSHPSS